MHRRWGLCALIRKMWYNVFMESANREEDGGKMPMRAYRLYRVVCCLAVALATVPVVMLLLRERGFMLLWEGYMAAATALAVLIGILLPYRSDRGLSKARKVLFAVLAAPAALQLAATAFWVVYVSDLLVNVRFAAAIRDADRIVIRDGGGGCCGARPDLEPELYVITNRSEIAEFNKMVVFDRMDLPCMCCGYPGIDWWKGGKRVVMTAVHHGQTLRWGSGFCGDAHFAPGSARRLQDWFKAHCGVDIREQGSPFYRKCFFMRAEIEAKADAWTKSHDGRRPSLDDLRNPVPDEGGRNGLSCPVGGAYSLEYDEDGRPVVTCGSAGHGWRPGGR